MKKSLVLSALILLLICALGVSASAFNEPTKEIEAVNNALNKNNYLNNVEPKTRWPFTYIIDPQNDMAIIIGCKSLERGNVNIPETLGGKPVYALAGSVFSSCPNLTSVHFPSTVASVSATAFLGSQSIKKITVDKASPFLYADDKGVLYSYNESELIYFPGGLSDTSYTVNSNVRHIGDYAFACNMKLTSVNLSKAQSVGYGAFMACGKLKGITVPDSVKEIGLYAFGYDAYGKTIPTFNIQAKNNLTAEMYALTNPVKFNGKTCTVKKINSTTYHFLNGKAALISHDNKNIQKVTVPSKINGYPVVAIGEYAFFYNRKLTMLDIPSSVVFIGEMAFACCDNLKNVYTTAKGLKIIGIDAFIGCNKLKNFSVPESVEIIGDGAFGITFDFQNSCLDMVPGFTLYGKENTVAFEYADYYNINFEPYKNAPLYKTKKITTDQNNTAVRLTWEAVAYAEGYRVYLKTSTGWKSLGITRSKTFTATGLKSGTYYTFAVLAGYERNGKAVWSDVYTTITTPTTTAAPSSVTYKQSGNKITLSWSKVTGATGYAVYQKQNNTWIKKGTTSSTQGTLSDFNPATIYEFAVKPYMKTDNGNINGYPKIIKTFTVPSMPSSSASSPAARTLSISWDSATGAKGYQLYYKIGNGEYQLYKNYPSAQTVTFKNLKSGTKYTIAIRAYTVSPLTSKYVYSTYNPIVVTIR